MFKLRLLVFLAFVDVGEDSAIVFISSRLFKKYYFVLYSISYFPLFQT